VVHELVSLDYLQRSPETTTDARRRPLTLTTRGRAALAASARIQEEIEQRWAEAAGGRRLATTRACLALILDDATANGRNVSLRPTW
jgi:DNA-binding MarR family transcriptional regulator